MGLAGCPKSRFAAIILFSASAAYAQTAPGDHYLCYKDKASSFLPAPKTLQDQFGTLNVAAKKLQELCNPAQVGSGAAPAYPAVHEVAYQISIAPKQPKITPGTHVAIDEFGNHTLVVGKPAQVLAPSALATGTGGVSTIDTTGVDHYECHKVAPPKGSPKFAGVPGIAVSDEFGAAQYDLTKITKLCAPVNKNNEDPTAPGHPGHLVCYSAKRSKGQTKFTAQDVSINNGNFGPATLTAKTIAEVCVPAFKDVVPTTTTTVTSTSTTTEPSSTTTSSTEASTTTTSTTEAPTTTTTTTTTATTSTTSTTSTTTTTSITSTTEAPTTTTTEAPTTTTSTTETTTTTTEPVTTTTSTTTSTTTTTVQCVVASDCAGADTFCATRTCTGGTCGTSFTAAGTVTPDQAGGDCHTNECDGAGSEVSVVDDTDLPTTGNQCASVACTNGVPSTPPVSAGTACNQNGGTLCDGSGNCVQCLAASDCPGTDTFCATRTCTGGTCGPSFTAAGTATPTQTSGDCHSNQCDGAGNVVNAVDNSDVPVDANQCTNDVCTNGVPSNPSSPSGTACSQNGGTACDGSGVCTNAVWLVRVGTGAAALDNGATALFVERYYVSNGASAGTTITLPTAASGSNKPVTVSGTASSEGALTRSRDSHYVTLAGYSAVPGTHGPGGATDSISNSTATNVPRDAARISAAGVVDSSTTFGTAAFNANNPRSAVTDDGSFIWAGGAGGATGGGIWYAALGASTSTRIISSPTNVRVAAIAGGQLFATSATNTLSLASVGSGEPTTSTTATLVPGFSTASSVSPYGYAFFRLTAGAANAQGFDTLYVTDDGTGATSGITKWRFDGTNWNLLSTFTSAATGLSAAPRYLAASALGGTVTLVVNTSEATANHVSVLVDTGSGTPTATNIVTAPANTRYAGVALAPQ